MEAIEAVLEKHKSRLKSIPGCTAVGIGYKQVDGELIDQHSIVVFVKKKSGNIAPGERVPVSIEGFPTDVMEKGFGVEMISTDPFARFEQIFSGISLAPWCNSLPWGTIGCIIDTTGNEHVIAGQYLLTCQHVLKYADPNYENSYSRIVVQPGRLPEPAPENYYCGNYVYGIQDGNNDCAIATIEYDRVWRNEVPNAPWYPGRRQLAGVAVAKVGDEVYKYGATTKYTRGVVRYIHMDAADYNIHDAIYIESVDGSAWAAKGDSGSILIRTRDDMVLGLNFSVNPQTLMDHPPVLPDNLPAYTAGYAYDIQRQMNNFGVIVHLATN